MLSAFEPQLWWKLDKLLTAFEPQLWWKDKLLTAGEPTQWWKTKSASSCWSKERNTNKTLLFFVFTSIPENVGSECEQSTRIVPQFSDCPVHKCDHFSSWFFVIFSMEQSFFQKDGKGRHPYLAYRAVWRLKNYSSHVTDDTCQYPLVDDDLWSFSCKTVKLCGFLNPCIFSGSGPRFRSCTVKNIVNDRQKISWFGRVCLVVSNTVVYPTT